MKYWVGAVITVLFMGSLLEASYKKESTVIVHIPNKCNLLDGKMK